MMSAHARTSSNVPNVVDVASVSPTNHMNERQTDECRIDERRAFLQQGASALGIALCSATIATILDSCQSPSSSNTTSPAPTGATTTIDVTQSALRSPGGAISQQFGSNNNGRNVIVIRTSQTEFVALSSVCTHDGCTVGLPTSAGANLVCPCHGSVFTQAGARVSGPASGALARFTTSFNASTNILTITF